MKIDTYFSITIVESLHKETYVFSEPATAYSAAASLARLTGLRVNVQSCARIWATWDKGVLLATRTWTDFYEVPARSDDAYADYSAWVVFDQNGPRTRDR